MQDHHQHEPTERAVGAPVEPEVYAGDEVALNAQTLRRLKLREVAASPSVDAARPARL
jgi:hypothetical protein